MLNAQHEHFIRSQSSVAGRDSFSTYINLVISKFLDKGGTFRDVDGNDINIYQHELSSKTIYNFLGIGLEALGRIHNKTLLYIEAYLGASGCKISFHRPDYLSTLGVSTSIQYRPVELDIEDIMSSLGRGEYRLFIFNGSTSGLPAPLQADCVLIWVAAIPGEHFFFVHLVPVIGPVEYSHIKRGGNDKSDWNESHYRGIGIATRDGISCHLTSVAIRIPLYVLLKVEDDQLQCAFVSYEAPGYLLQYTKVEKYDDIKATSYFEELEIVL